MARLSAAARGTAAQKHEVAGDRTRVGRKVRTLNAVEPGGLPEIDEASRECLANRRARRLGLTEVIGVPTELFMARGTSGGVHSDDGPEFVATESGRPSACW